MTVLTSWWAAPTPATPVEAVVSLPGSKSLTNRVLLLAALADGPSTVTRPLHARDTELMADALRALGVGVDPAGTAGDDWTVTPAPLRGPATVDCGLAGTVMRFVPPVAALAAGAVGFDGDPAARERPMAQTVATLRALGVSIDDGGRGALPFTVHGTGSVAGGTVELDASSSSQFVSALLLAGARYSHGVDVRHRGKPVPSLPHIDMTVSQLRVRGVAVDDTEPDRWVVGPGAIRPAGLRGRARPVQRRAVRGRGPGHRGPGARTRLAAPHRPGRRPAAPPAGGVRRGGDARRRRPGGRGPPASSPGSASTCTTSASSRPSWRRCARWPVRPRSSAASPICAATRPTGSPLSPSEIGRLGGHVEEQPDGLRIEPRPLHAGRWSTYADHRMAHAGAVIGLAVPGVEVENVVTTAKTFPGFAQLWERLMA